MAFKHSNPAIEKAVNNDYVYEEGFASASYFSIGLKILFYVAMTLIGAFLGIFMLSNNPSLLLGFLIVSGIVTFICAFVAMSKPKVSMIFGSLYCIGEGIFIGVLSLLFEAMVSGVIMVAALGTLSVVLVVAVFYMTGLVKVNNGFYRFLLMFAMGFIICMVLSFVLSLFPAFDGLFSNIGVVLLTSGLSLLLASFFLISDMAQIRQVVESGQSKEMEWLVAFGFAYTVLWIYLQVLRIAVVLLARND